MAEKKLAKGLKCSEGNLYQFIPPIATKDEFGGIKANARTTETKEVAIDDTTGKLYVYDFEPVTNELRTGIDDLQNQIDNIVIETSENSDATAEVIQARVGADGTNHPTLKDRLDTEQNALKTDILSVKEDLNRLAKENSNRADLWEQGGIDDSGIEFPSTVQIRTKDYLPQNIKRIVANEGYKIRAVAYSTDGSFAGFWNGTSLQDAVVSLNSLNVYDLDGYYVRLVIYKGGAEIDVDDFVNIRFINDIYDKIEEVDEKVNRDIRQYSSENVIPFKTEAWEANGITITPNDEGSYTLTGGTPTKAGGTWIYNSETELPSNILRGNKYRLGKAIPVGCILNIRFYDGASWSDTIQITTTTPYADVIVPENATGLRVQLYFTSTANFDGVVVETEMISTSSTKYVQNNIENSIYPRVELVETTTESLSKEIKKYSSENVIPTKDTAWEQGGITITPTGNGTYLLTGGVPTETKTQILYFSETVLPPNIIPGNEYKLGKNLPAGITLSVRCFNGSEWGSTVSVEKAEPHKTFVVPDDTTGFQTRLYLSATYGNFDNTVIETEMISTSSVKHALEVVEEYHKKDVPLPLLTIIDDDGHKKFESLLLPIVQAKKVPISSAVIVENVTASPDNTMSWEQIENCALNGAEILSHTYTHLTDLASENMTVEEIAYDYRLAQYHLRKNGYKSEILIFAGASSLNDKNINACKQVYSYGFKAGTNKTNYKGEIDRYGIDRWAVSPTATYDDLKAMIDQLLAEGTGWMIWMVHTNSGEFQQEFANILSTVIDYAISQGLTIGTAEYGCKLYCD
jgi:hypothetical protein